MVAIYLCVWQLSDQDSTSGLLTCGYASYGRVSTDLAFEAFSCTALITTLLELCFWTKHGPSHPDKFAGLTSQDQHSMPTREVVIAPDLQGSQVGYFLHFPSDFGQLVLQLLLLSVQLLQPALEGCWVFTPGGSSCCCPVQLHKLLLVALHLLIQLLDVLVLRAVWWDLQHQSTVNQVSSIHCQSTVINPFMTSMISIGISSSSSSNFCCLCC